jgi:hypothetical protein
VPSVQASLIYPDSTGHGPRLRMLEAEAGNLATAVRWHLAHDRDPLPRLFRVLCTFWILRDHSGEARSWLGQLLPTADSLGAQARAELMWTALVIANEVGDDPAALAARDRLASLLDKINDSYLRAVSPAAHPPSWRATRFCPTSAPAAGCGTSRYATRAARGSR